MSRTITRLFDNYADAESAVAALERLGVPETDISIVAPNADKAHDHRVVRKGDGETAGEAAADDAGKGATAGGLVGAAGGVLAGLGLLAIPGLGPVVAAGWLASTAVGAIAGAVAGGAVGGLVGALTHAGVPEKDANVYAEGVRRGGTLVSAKVADDKAAGAEAALNNLRAVDATTRGAAYRDAGWRGFDPNAAPYSTEEIAAERSRYTR
jgi:hypothetical protein